jgi:hypothetical protein
MTLPSRLVMFALAVFATAQIVGVCAPVCSPVVQQGSDPMWVSPQENVVTQYGLARNIGLLAHDYEAGGQWKSLRVGDAVYIVYGSSRVVVWRVVSVENVRYISDSVLFQRYYGKPGTLVLQTCEGLGRLFVVAEREE